MAFAADKTVLTCIFILASLSPGGSAPNDPPSKIDPYFCPTSDFTSAGEMVSGIKGRFFEI